MPGEKHDEGDGDTEEAAILGGVLELFDFKLIHDIHHTLNIESPATMNTKAIINANSGEPKTEFIANRNMSSSKRVIIDLYRRMVDATNRARRWHMARLLADWLSERQRERITLVGRRQ